MSHDAIAGLVKMATIVGIVSLIVMRPEAFDKALTGIVQVISNMMKLG